MELRKKYLDFDVEGGKCYLIFNKGSFNKKSIDENRLSLRKQNFFKKILEIKEKQIKEKSDYDLTKKLKDLNIPDEIKYVNFQSNVFNDLLMLIY